MTNGIKIFSGTSNKPFAEAVCRELSQRLSECETGRYKDGQPEIEILEPVAADTVFVIQSCQPPEPGHHFLELMEMGEALRSACPARLYAVTPATFGDRDDRRGGKCVPISIKVFYATLEHAGRYDGHICVDIHSDQSEAAAGKLQFHQLRASPLLLSTFHTLGFDARNTTVISPDTGGAKRAEFYARNLGCPLAIAYKKRKGPGESETFGFSHGGENVSGHHGLIIDDIIDSANTLVKAAEAAAKQGAKRLVAFATHPVFSTPAVQRISDCEALEAVIVTDTIQLSDQARGCPKIRQVSMAKRMAEAFRRIHHGESIARLNEIDDTFLQ